MPRKPKAPEPWQRKDRNNDWYATVRVGTKQKQVYLADGQATEQEVENALARVLMQTNVEASREDGPAVPLLDRFLDHAEKHQAPESYRMRKKFLQSFINYLKKVGQLGIAVNDLKPYHVQQWLDHNPQWGSSSRRIAIGSLSAALNWAVQDGYIDAHPLSGKLKRPPRKSRGREAYMPEGIYREWLGYCRHGV